MTYDVKYTYCLNRKLEYNGVRRAKSTLLNIVNVIGYFIYMKEVVMYSICMYTCLYTIYMQHAYVNMGIGSDS